MWQIKIVKNADLKFFKDMYSGQSAAEIANRVIARFRPTIEPQIHASTGSEYAHCDRSKPRSVTTVKSLISDQDITFTSADHNLDPGALSSVVSSGVANSTPQNPMLEGENT